MEADEYREMRRSLGTQEEVARRLGVDKMTVSRRERGVIPVDREAELALRHLAESEEGDR